MNEYVIALLKCKGIGPVKLLKHIQNNNFDEKLILKNLKDIIPNVTEEDFAKCLTAAKDEIELQVKHNIKLITLFDKDYPSRLYLIPKPVLYLYYKGDFSLTREKGVAIIGTRSPSDLALKNTYLLCDKLKASNYVIVSGLALGIDSAAHEGCLKNKGKTIAVLPSDLINIYPEENKNLSNKILEKGGCLVSEYPVGSVMQNYNFAERNRIQSALSNLVVVSEARENSGTMITVDYAKTQSKPVIQMYPNQSKNIFESLHVDDISTIDIIKKYVEDNYKEMLEKEQLLLKKDKPVQQSLFE